MRGMRPLAGAARGAVGPIVPARDAPAVPLAGSLAVIDGAVTRLAGDRITALALFLTVIGWGLVWACALALVAVVPMWAAALVFSFGLALIPFRPIGRD